MKRLLLAAALLTIITGSAEAEDFLPDRDTIRAGQQDTTIIRRHLAFKGVEITGTINSIERRLSQKGFNGGGTMTGMFAGYDVIVKITGTKKSKTAYMITAYTNTNPTWKEAEDDFEIFRRNLLFKYGVPEREDEVFSDPYRKGDGYEMRAYQTGNARHSAEWSTDMGRIILEMTPKGSGLCLRIVYIDAQGAMLESRESAELFSDDL